MRRVTLFAERTQDEIMVVLVRDARDVAVRRLLECKEVYPDWQSRERLCHIWQEQVKADEIIIDDNLRCWRQNQIKINEHKAKR